MRFLVNTKSKHPIPPEMMPGLLDAMLDWANRYKASGKMQDIWSFAGIPGGGGIMNVDSLEELDEILGAFPFGPFSEVEVIPLAELTPSIQRAKRMVEAMASARPRT